MGCSGRPKASEIRPEQKWDFISLTDFKSTSCLTPFAYGYLWISLIISTAVYAVDTFTAVNLLAFNKWSGEIKPYIPLDVSKWIFSGCIIASWVNLAFEHLRAYRVMRRGAVAESYLDNLAVRLESVRLGKTGKGWKRFLVFAELTKSKQGVEYVALFTYFSFQSWIRIIFCQGPRQVINALTLYSVFSAKLDPTDSADVGSFLVTFFKNVGILAQEEHQQALILSGMVFTLVIWIFGALSMILASLFYGLFLWHYIPSSDGGLSGYCARKINGRLTKIVSVKINKALEEDERQRLKAEQKAAKKGEKAPPGRQATIPTLFDKKDEDKLPNMPMLNRNDTMTTLPLYSSRPGTPSTPVPGDFELGALDQKRPFANRNPSNMSNTSYASDAPLMGNAGDMGYGRSASPAPSIPEGGFAPPQRQMTGGSINSQWRGPQPPRMPTAIGDRGYTQSPASFEGRNTPGIQRQDTMDQYGRPMPRAIGELQGRSNTPAGPAPSMGRRTPFDPAMNGRSSPAPGLEYGNGRNSPAPSNQGGYQAYQPYASNQDQQRSASAAPTSQSQQVYEMSSTPSPSSASQFGQFRNLTDPGMRPPPTRGATADFYGVRNNASELPSPVRAATTGPMMGRPGTPQGQGQPGQHQVQRSGDWMGQGIPRTGTPTGFGAQGGGGYRR